MCSAVHLPDKNPVVFTFMPKNKTRHKVVNYGVLKGKKVYLILHGKIISGNSIFSDRKVALSVGLRVAPGGFYFLEMKYS